MSARQETPYRNDLASPFGAAILSAVQDLPFHISANPKALVPEGFVLKPATAHIVAEGHETSLSVMFAAPAGTAAFIAVKTLPFHLTRSIAGAPGIEEYDSPTTTQNVTKWQETAPGYVDRAPPGMLAVCSVHFAPFQVSTSSGPAPPCELPTATQLLTVMQEMPVRDVKMLPLGTGGAAVGVSDVPFQVRAYGRAVPAPASVVYVPTITQAVADLQETAARLRSATVGFGVGTATERHAVPFHATTAWAKSPDLLMFSPIARQEFGVPHEILPLMMNAVTGVPGFRSAKGAAVAAAAVGRALPPATASAISANSPDMTILRTERLRLSRQYNNATSTRATSRHSMTDNANTAEYAMKYRRPRRA